MGSEWEKRTSSKDIISFSNFLLELDIQDNDFHEDTWSRTIIGRAYYAAFWETRDFLYNCFGETLMVVTPGEKKKSIHLQLQNILSEFGYPELSIALKSLFMKRIEADYKKIKIFTKKKAEIAIKESTKIIKKTNGIRTREDC